MRKCDGAGAANGIELLQARAAVHEAGADGAKSAKVARYVRDWDVIEHALCGWACGSALEAIQLAGSAMDFANGAPLFEECPEFGPVNEMRPRARHRGKANPNPVSDGLPIDVVEPGDFLNRVGAVDLGPARIEALAGHGSSRPGLDEPADVFHAPCRDAGAELDRAGISARFHASPPRRARHGDRPTRREDGGEPDEAGFGECEGG